MSAIFVIPHGWTETTFGAVVSVVPVNDKKLPGGEYLESGRFPVVDQGQKFIGGYTNDEIRVISDDLPLLVFGDHTRAFKYLDQPFVPGADGVKVLKPLGVDAKWLYQIAHALEFPDKGYARHYQHLKSAKLFVPPLSEQRRIVAEIEKQFTRLEAGMAALRRVQANLKRYRAAVLKAACEGKLVPTEAALAKTAKRKVKFESGEELLARIFTERRKNWRSRGQYREPDAPDTSKLPKLSNGWRWATLDALAEIKGGITKDQNRKHNAPARSVPYLRVANVQRGYIDLGKTSLALAVAHDLAALNVPPFEHIVWLSARDVDLRPTGPSEVQPSVVDLQSVSKRFGRLFSDWGGGEDAEALAKALQEPSGVLSKGILFVFDNFETLADVRGLHKFLDEHTHLPNKALITSRERAFVADYPIEVRGMELPEAEQMLTNAARTLGIEHLMTPDAIDRIYAYTGGHAYVMRVVVGEMAKDGRYTPPAQVMGRRQDIVDAVFERSFNKLSEAGRNVFLLVANWKSNVPEVDLIVILGVRGIDAMAGLEECRRLSLVYLMEIPSSQSFYSVPQLARGFAHKKLQGDPDRLVIQQDLVTLQKFGVVSAIPTGEDSESRLIAQFTKECFGEIGKGSEAVARADKLLEALSNSWSPGWRKLAAFRRQSSADRESIGYALRRAVEEEPFSKDAWLDRAEFAKLVSDEAVQIASLVSAVDADPSDVELVREVAFQLCRYINSHIQQIPKARRGVYLASVRSHMQRVSSRLDATGLSRLAWLFLLEDNVTKAREYAEKGCAIDPTNSHCLKILERLDEQTGGVFEG